jgi:hypothetical protein
VSAHVASKYVMIRGMAFMHSIVPCGFLEITKMHTWRRTYAAVGLRVRSQSVIARARTTAGGHTTCLGMHAPTRGAPFWPEKTSSARLPDHSTTTKQRRDAFGGLPKKTREPASAA